MTLMRSKGFLGLEVDKDDASTLIRYLSESAPRKKQKPNR
jgi:hypothetical protein